MFFNCW